MGLETAKRSTDWTIERTAGPTKLPVSLELTKQKLRISGSALDLELLTTIEAVTNLFEQDTDIIAITQSYRYRRQRAPAAGQRIQLSKRPLQAVNAVTYGGVTVPSDQYAVNLGSRELWLMSGGTWGEANDEDYSFQVDAVHGYGDDPEDVDRLAQMAVLTGVAAAFYGNTSEAEAYQRSYDDFVARLLRASYP